MEGNRRREEGNSPRLLDLIPKSSEWSKSQELTKEEAERSHERKLELRLGLGPPGQSQTTQNMNNHYKKTNPTFSLPPQDNNPSHKRSGSAQQVVGWPPIRSFRKNLSNTTTTTSNTINSQKQKQYPNNNNNNNNKAENNNDDNNKNKKLEIVDESDKKNKKGMFVKINMEGVPIGRKVDLSAYDNYHSLESVVDHLFRGLLSAQSESNEEEKAIRGLMDGSGEYTLVYEDNEGDRMLVGDVPWNMFVSTVKRLRVLKSSELSLVSKTT